MSNDINDNSQNTMESNNGNGNKKFKFNLEKELKILKNSFLSIGLFIVAFILISTCTFTVDEANQAVVTRFGEVKKIILDEKTPELEKSIAENPKFKSVKIIARKGLFFKVPFLDNVNLYDNRLLTYDTNPREVTTKDKKKLILDNNAQWKIENPALFSLSMRNIQSAHTKLDDIMFSKMNEKIGQTEAHVLIADKEYTNNMLNDIGKDVNLAVSEYGIKVVDIKIKRTDLPPENSQNIFNRMKTEREQKAKEYRSEGKEEAQKIKSDADKQAKILEAKAYATSEDIKGQGDAEATEIYNNAYNADPEFYEFYRTLQVYKKTLNDKTKLIIDSNSPFAKYLLGE